MYCFVERVKCLNKVACVPVYTYLIAAIIFAINLVQVCTYMYACVYCDVDLHVCNIYMYM